MSTSTLASIYGLRTWTFWRPCLALFLAVLFSSLIDFSSLPASIGYLSEIGGPPRFVGAVAMLVTAMVLALRPSSRAVRWSHVGFFAVLVAGLAAFVVGAFSGNAGLVNVSAWLMAIGCMWVIVTTYTAIATLGKRPMALAVTFGFGLSALACFLLSFAPHLVRTGVFVLAAPISYALAARDLRPALEEAAPLSSMRGNGEMRRALSTIRRLLLLVFLYEAAYGFSIHSALSTDIPLSPAAGILPAIALTAYLLIGKRGFPDETPTAISILFAVAGFLITSMDFSYATLVGNSCIAISVFLFLVSMRCYFCALGREIPAAEMALYTSSVGISGLGFSLGSFLGTASLRALSASPGLMTLMMSLFILAFFIACIFTLRGSDVSSALEATGTSGEPKTPAAHPTPFKDAVGEIAGQNGLSPRETEVFILLARGRNRERIQDALVVSRDTAKAHIKHVYSKLGVHSQQELIDLVERELGEG